MENKLKRKKTFTSNNTNSQYFIKEKFDYKSENQLNKTNICTSPGYKTNSFNSLSKENFINDTNLRSNVKSLYSNFSKNIEIKEKIESDSRLMKQNTIFSKIDHKVCENVIANTKFSNQKKKDIKDDDFNYKYYKYVIDDSFLINNKLDRLFSSQDLNIKNKKTLKKEFTLDIEENVDEINNVYEFHTCMDKSNLDGHNFTHHRVSKSYKKYHDSLNKKNEDRNKFKSTVTIKKYVSSRCLGDNKNMTMNTNLSFLNNSFDTKDKHAKTENNKEENNLSEPKTNELLRRKTGSTLNSLIIKNNNKLENSFSLAVSKWKTNTDNFNVNILEKDEKNINFNNTENLFKSMNLNRKVKFLSNDFESTLLINNNEFEKSYNNRNNFISTKSFDFSKQFSFENVKDEQREYKYKDSVIKYYNHELNRSKRKNNYKNSNRKNKSYDKPTKSSERKVKSVENMETLTLRGKDNQKIFKDYEEMKNINNYNNFNNNMIVKESYEKEINRLILKDYNKFENKRNESEIKIRPNSSRLNHKELNVKPKNDYKFTFNSKELDDINELKVSCNSIIKDKHIYSCRLFESNKSKNFDQKKLVIVENNIKNENINDNNNDKTGIIHDCPNINSVKEIIKTNLHTHPDAIISIKEESDFVLTTNNNENNDEINKNTLFKSDEKNIVETNGDVILNSNDKIENILSSESNEDKKCLEVEIITNQINNKLQECKIEKLNEEFLEDENLTITEPYVLKCKNLIQTETERMQVSSLRKHIVEKEKSTKQHYKSSNFNNDLKYKKNNDFNQTNKEIRTSKSKKFYIHIKNNSNNFSVKNLKMTGKDKVNTKNEIKYYANTNTSFNNNVEIFEFVNDYFEKYNYQNNAYKILKEYSHNHKINPKVPFLQRMKYYEIKKQNKENKTMELANKIIPKVKEKDKIECINNLLIDYNRREMTKNHINQNYLAIQSSISGNNCFVKKSKSPMEIERFHSEMRKKEIETEDRKRMMIREKMMKENENEKANLIEQKKYRKIGSKDKIEGIVNRLSRVKLNFKDENTFIQNVGNLENSTNKNNIGLKNNDEKNANNLYNVINSSYSQKLSPDKYFFNSLRSAISTSLNKEETGCTSKQNYEYKKKIKLVKDNNSYNYLIGSKSDKYSNLKNRYLFSNSLNSEDLESLDNKNDDFKNSMKSKLSHSINNKKTSLKGSLNQLNNNENKLNDRFDTIKEDAIENDDIRYCNQSNKKLNSEKELNLETNVFLQTDYSTNFNQLYKEENVNRDIKIKMEYNRNNNNMNDNNETSFNLKTNSNHSILNLKNQAYRNNNIISRVNVNKNKFLVKKNHNKNQISINLNENVKTEPSLNNHNLIFKSKNNYSKKDQIGKVKLEYEDLINNLNIKEKKNARVIEDNKIKYLLDKVFN